MPKFKSYNYDQTIMVPVNLQDQLVPGSLEFAIHYLVDNEIDLSGFEARFKNDEEGRPGYDPRILLKVVLTGYSRGIVHSRKLERACHENIIFMAMACGQTPDHSTIAHFVSSMQDLILIVFRDILLVCEKEGLLGGTSFSLDGLKLPSNASKQMSGTFSELEHKKKKLEERVQRLLKKQIDKDRKDTEDIIERDRKNKEKQIHRLKRRAEKIGRFLEENKPKKSARGNKELKSNVTDNDSCKMVTMHGTIQGYNGQAIVDDKHQVIVHGEASGKGQDYQHVETMIDGAKENTRVIGLGEDYFKGKELTADSNYNSTAGLKKCMTEEIDAYIPDPHFRKRDPRFKNQGRYKSKKKRKLFKLEDFQYEKESDRYICPGGESLTIRAHHAKIGLKNYKRYGAPEGVCERCKFKKRCMPCPTAKRKYLAVDLGYSPENLIGQMIKKIDSEKGRKRYERRLAIVEPVFANIRTQKKLDRFTLRGQSKVNVQWLLFCMIHNIEKIVNYGTGFA
jgi:transposase